MSKFAVTLNYHGNYGYVEYDSENKKAEIVLGVAEAKAKVEKFLNEKLTLDVQEGDTVRQFVTKTLDPLENLDNFKKESSHLAASGNSLHEKAGPHVPSPGPILPILEITVPIDSRKPTPSPIMISMLMIAMTAYKKVKANTVDWMEGEITCLLTRTGSLHCIGIPYCDCE